MNEQAIKDEMRLFALESIVCQHLATAYQQMAPKIFEAVPLQALYSRRCEGWPAAAEVNRQA
jgi:hypothetical protein